jgi:hypothetical protein
MNILLLTEHSVEPPHVQDDILTSKISKNIVFLSLIYNFIPTHFREILPLHTAYGTVYHLRSFRLYVPVELFRMKYTANNARIQFIFIMNKHHGAEVS